LAKNYKQQCDNMLKDKRCLGFRNSWQFCFIGYPKKEAGTPSTQLANEAPASGIRQLN